MSEGTKLKKGIAAVWILLLLMASGLAFDARGEDKEKKTSSVEEAKQKAKEAMEKLKKDVDKADKTDVDEMKKLASEKMASGKEALGKQLEKAKGKSEEVKDKLKKDKEAEEKKGNAGDNNGKANGSDKAKGEAEHPGKHLGEAKKAEADATDSDSAGKEDEEKARDIRRRELGYLMHRRYLGTNEKHQQLMKQIGEKKGLKMSEQHKHYRRIARLERLRELAVDIDDAEKIKTIDALLQQEITRHENVMVELHKQAKQDVKQGDKEGK
ncbi:MAG: hypothetical protein JXR76_30550 [Deltaproteobacteria bacterium]|nr:hypothetical protein [Deltaproteobacteria bacterium]